MQSIAKEVIYLVMQERKILYIQQIGVAIPPEMEIEDVTEIELEDIPVKPPGKKPDVALKDAPADQVIYYKNNNHFNYQYVSNQSLFIT